MKRPLLLAIALLIFTTIANAKEYSSQAEKFEIEEVADKLENPWGMDFLPDGRMLVTERPGRLRIVSKNGELSGPLSGVPKVLNDGQGGLLDVVADPDFENNRMIYLSYAEPELDKAGTAVAKAKLVQGGLKDIKVIWRQTPKTDGSNHFGSRLVFGGDGKLYVTTGERFNYSEKAQKLDNTLGKLIRINSDGSIPEDNPFVNTESALPEIYSYGHRNIQGAAVNPESGKLWIHEHGARGGDEINIPDAAKNFGWPEASYGSHYSMLPIPDEHAKRGFVEPIYHWTPSIAPSGMEFYTGNKFPKWQGNLFIGALAEKDLVRLALNGDKIIHEEKLLKDIDARIRDVETGPDGYIYILTDAEDGKLLRLVPAKE